jgi:hypothetical protein
MKYAQFSLVGWFCMTKQRTDRVSGLQARTPLTYLPRVIVVVRAESAKLFKNDVFRLHQFPFNFACFAARFLRAICQCVLPLEIFEKNPICSAAVF